ncbi:protein of unknown function [Streptomyces sp. 2131.1]|uniref:DUF4253 domain-containing protein n=1 Tax=Streptomyces sp. 2131.1 TaxID=1855346 RepID=UPI00089A56C5|nr:DUF4253 domain-containing protein [Streptomyces sp. 2131.1]SEB65633.1 protein of unknown function [Streptomyces sp. 2131.1]
MFTLPDALPPGRFLTLGLSPVWVSDGFPRDVEALWPRLLNEHRSHGLVPLLCRPDEMGRPVAPHDVEPLPLDEVLAADFVAYRRHRLPFWADPTPAPVPEGIDVEPWPHDPGPPFEQWPGLAAEVPVTSTSTTPEEAASRTLTGLVRAGRGLIDLRGCRLVLVPAPRSGDALALLGWFSEAPLPLLCALLRSWDDRFGARIVAVSGSTAYLSVARPPLDTDQAQLLALEHLLSTADNIVDDPPTPFPAYASDLVGRTDWSFWWD